MPAQYNNIKLCTKCKTIYSGDLSLYFHNSKKNKDGYSVQCRECDHIRYLTNREKNKERYNKNRREFYENNKEKMREYRKKQYYGRREHKLLQQRQYNEKFASYSICGEKVGRYNWVGENEDGYLLVECHNCGKHMIPTNRQVRSRLSCVARLGHGDANFYCSQECKNECPIFYQQKTPKNISLSKESRDVPSWLITEVKDRDNWTCQRCFAKKAPLEVHHILPYTQNKVLGCDKDNLITYCKKCHKKIHKKPGMRTTDLGCAESTPRE